MYKNLKCFILRYKTSLGNNTKYLFSGLLYYIRVYTALRCLIIIIRTLIMIILYLYLNTDIHLCQPLDDVNNSEHRRINKHWTQRESAENWDDSIFKEKFISKCKYEFKEFYATYKKSISSSSVLHSTEEFDKLNAKFANAYYEGASMDKALNELPNEVRSLYKEFLVKKKYKEI